MAGLNQTSWRPYANEPDVKTVHVRVTGAADVQASGYTVSGKEITSATRTGEGLFTIKLKVNYSSVATHSVGLDVAGQALTCVRNTAADSLTATGGSVLGFKVVTSGTSTAIDPDGAVLSLTLNFKTSRA